VTGTVTGSGRAFEAIEDLGRSLTDAERALRKALRMSATACTGPTATA